eukprot:4042893-Amphidinium_carterae.1
MSHSDSDESRRRPSGRRAWITEQAMSGAKPKSHATPPATATKSAQDATVVVPLAESPAYWPARMKKTFL